jgi:hypothetical protein
MRVSAQKLRRYATAVARVKKKFRLDKKLMQLIAIRRFMPVWALTMRPEMA